MGFHIVPMGGGGGRLIKLTINVEKYKAKISEVSIFSM
jgi:hypothetical protein